MASFIFAQTEAKEKGILANFTYAVQLPAGDLDESFGLNYNLGVNVQYMTKKKFLFGANVNYLFRDDVKIDVLANLRTMEGEIIGQDREYAVVSLEQRGVYAGLEIGKILPIFAVNSNSGIRIVLGGGMLQHKFRLDDKTGDVPQLAGDYIKGYDRLTYGFALSEFIGYQYLSTDKLINFYAGFEFVQGFTQNRRSWDYLENRRMDEKRLDLLNGFRIGWVLPLYGTDNPEEIFY